MESDTYQEYDSTKSIVVAILTKIAEREGDPPAELTPPLYDVIEPDALETLFRKPIYGESRDTVSLEFTYLDYRVVVRGPDDIEIHDT